VSGAILRLTETNSGPAKHAPTGHEARADRFRDARPRLDMEIGRLRLVTTAIKRSVVADHGEPGALEDIAEAIRHMIGHFLPLGIEVGMQAFQFIEQINAVLH